MAEEVTAVPSTSLHDGQQVTVSVKGFVPTTKFYLSECETPTQANHLGCGVQLAAQPFGLTDENGQGSASFTVQSSAATEPLSADSVPCSGECVIVATSGSGGSFGFTPITFAG
jgi:Neocarzinostatin family